MALRKPLLVGSNPDFLGVTSRTRLARVCGLLSTEDVSELFLLMHLLPEHIPYGRVTDWDDARARARKIQRKFLSRRVVLFGDDVRRAFQIRRNIAPPLTYFEVGPAWVALCPNLSGRAKYWTDIGNTDRAREFFSVLVLEANRCA